MNLKNFKHLILCALFAPALGQGETVVKVLGYSNPKRFGPVMEKFNETIGKKYDFKAVYERDKKKVMNSLQEGTAGELKIDILQVPDVAYLGYAKEQKVYVPIESETLKKNIPGYLRDPQNKWFGITKRARVLAYNSELIDEEELSTYEDLANPKWKNKLCLRTSKKTYNISLIQFFKQIKGEKETKKMIKGWMDNNPKIQQKDMQVLKAIHDGDCLVGVVNTYYLGHFLESQNPEREDYPNSPVKMFFPNQDSYGAHINIKPFGVHKNSQHKKLAQKVIEYLSTKEVQEALTMGNEIFGGSHEHPVNPVAQLKGYVRGLGTYSENKYMVFDYTSEEKKKSHQLMKDLGWN